MLLVECPNGYRVWCSASEAADMILALAHEEDVRRELAALRLAVEGVIGP